MPTPVRDNLNQGRPSTLWFLPERLEATKPSFCQRASNPSSCDGAKVKPRPGQAPSIRRLQPKGATKERATYSPSVAAVAVQQHRIAKERPVGPAKEQRTLRVQVVRASARRATAEQHQEEQLGSSPYRVKPRHPLVPSSPNRFAQASKQNLGATCGVFPWQNLDRTGDAAQRANGLGAWSSGGGGRRRRRKKVSGLVTKGCFKGNAERESGFAVDRRRRRQVPALRGRSRRPWLESESRTTTARSALQG